MSKSTSSRLDGLFSAIETPKPKRKRSLPDRQTNNSNPDSIPTDRRAGGRARRYAERIVPITISVAPEHIRYIDAISVAITKRTGRPCGRGEIVRALIDALTAAGVDLTRAATDAEIRAILTKRLSDI